MASRRIESSNYRNPCITMHQPWASLLVYGIKRIEGRSWPSPIRGRLWIHAAGKVPEPETVKAMEEFYREIYKLNGVTDIKFPEHYPVSRLLGCVDVVGCLTCEELVNWEAIPASVRVEGQTAFCWLCEKPQRLIVPFEMRGFQGVYNLEKKIYEAAVRGLSSVKAPQPVTFPLPEPRDRFSLKPGSLASFPSCTSTSAEEKPPSLVAAIAGARAAATQFSKNNIPRAPKTGSIEGNGKPISTRTGDKSKEWLPVQRAGGDTPDSSSSKIGL
ncbi:activating signal cointegrator 1-like [Salvia splendens]|uniref:activating signal cointegrator 1-like n=1 Tax=Salvia splendens TaxID=180675 RepID=UPI001C272C64|nr:activating signal cointegrator 1-like [Salvia splendens]